MSQGGYGRGVIILAVPTRHGAVLIRILALAN
jgi:hypothetical protein